MRRTSPDACSLPSPRVPQSASEPATRRLPMRSMAKPSREPRSLGWRSRPGCPFSGIWLHAPLATRMERVSARSGDASDADAEVVMRQAAALDRIPTDWCSVRADRPAEEIADEVLAMLATAQEVLTCAVASRSRSCPASSRSPSVAIHPMGWRRAGTSRRTARSRSCAWARAGAEAAFARWGLLGPWMKEANDPGRQINARVRDPRPRSRCSATASERGAA